jgi:hypothetical protein
MVISKEVSQLLDKNKTCVARTTTLGEVETAANFITSHLNGQSSIYYDVDTTSLPAFANPLAYLLKRQNVLAVGIEANENYVREIDSPVFILGCQLKKSYPYPYTRINDIYIYQANQ